MDWSWPELLAYVHTASIMGSIATVISIIFTAHSFFKKEKHKEESERQRASENLYGELGDAKDALDIKLHHDDFHETRIPNHPPKKYMHRHLNHDFYDSMVFSGKINYLRHELQQGIQDVFNLIKFHNKRKDEIMMFIWEKKYDRAYACCLAIESIEEKLREALPIAMEALRQDMQAKS